MTNRLKNNICIGQGAGCNLAFGSNSLFLGADAGADIATANNLCIITRSGKQILRTIVDHPSWSDALWDVRNTLGIDNVKSKLSQMHELIGIDQQLLADVLAEI